MLESLRVRHFQPHEDLTISFGPGVTALCGDSERGKSAVLRALTWVLTNQGPAAEFIGQWGAAPFALGRLAIDGHVVYRKRGKENLYRLDGGPPLRAFGSGVPQQIAQLANVSDVNFQGQLDGPYWFLQSPGQVAKNLNAIVNLQVVDACLADAGSRVRAAKSRLEVCEERLKAAEAKQADLAWAVEADRLLTALEAAHARLESVRERRAELSRLAAAVRSAAAKAAEAAKIAAAATVLLERAKVLVAVRANRAALADLAARIGRANDLAKLPIPDPRPVEQARSRYKTACQERNALEVLLFGELQLRSEVCQYEKRIQALEAELSTEAKNRCPTCGGPWNRRTLSPSPTSTSPSGDPRLEPNRTGLTYRRTASPGSTS